ncbi:MAG: aminotransferase class I/II-fold pyridoxal phosphate-dependent enzyme [Candidatus Fimenecus sp.]
MSKADLLSALQAYGESDAYPFHMPGHKRNATMLGNALPYSVDITEIDGFDDLHAPEGILKDLNDRLAALYGAKHSFALVNGSTCGILAGIAAATQSGNKILLARNCHKSVYNAVELLGLVPVYIQPPTDEKTGMAGSIAPESVAEALKKHKDIRLCVLTSPTYDGIISDIRTIAALLHTKDIPLMVDEAHGAHLLFTKQKMLSAVASGADIVIHSLHKTLPALTQTAAAHLCTDRISPTAFQRKLSVFESSSPSYVLLASISACVRFLEEKAETAFAVYEKELADFSEKCKTLTQLTVLCKGTDRLEMHPAFFAFDGGKLPIVTANTNTDGVSLLQKLRTAYKIEGEMAAVSYALLMTSVCDTADGFARLFTALQEIDCTLEIAPVSPQFDAVPLPPVVFSPDAAAKQTGACVPLQNAIEKVSLNTVWCYPPGVPVLVRGERVTKEIADALKTAKAHGVKVLSDGGEFPKIAVCD